MNKQQAEYFVSGITRLFSGKNLVTCATKPDNRPPEILVNQRLKSIAAHEYSDGNDRWFLVINDSYGVVTGDNIIINPNNRSFALKGDNAYGETLYFSWQYQEEVDIYGSYQEFYDFYKGIPR